MARAALGREGGAMAAWPLREAHAQTRQAADDGANGADSALTLSHSGCRSPVGPSPVYPSTGMRTWGVGSERN